MTPSISVRAVATHTFEVTVKAARTTVHIVRASPHYVAKLARPSESAEALVVRAFEFLLAREPNTSILAEFELSVIGRYFPEFERTITTDSSA
jgi:hypothetical protein